MTRHGMVGTAALVLAYPTIAAAHGHPLVLLAPVLIVAMKLIAMAITIVAAVAVPAAVATFASLVVVVIARLSRVRLRFLLEWVIRSYVLSYAVLAASLLMVLGPAGELVGGPGAPATTEQWADKWFVAIQAGGWVCVTMYLILIPLPMIAFLIAFFVRRRAYREVET